MGPKAGSIYILGALGPYSYAYEDLGVSNNQEPNVDPE